MAQSRTEAFRRRVTTTTHTAPNCAPGAALRTHLTREFTNPCKIPVQWVLLSSLHR